MLSHDRMEVSHISKNVMDFIEAFKGSGSSWDRNHSSHQPRIAHGSSSTRQSSSSSSFSNIIIFRLLVLMIRLMGSIGDFTHRSWMPFQHDLLVTGSWHQTWISRRRSLSNVHGCVGFDHGRSRGSSGTTPLGVMCLCCHFVRQLMDIFDCPHFHKQHHAPCSVIIFGHQLFGFMINCLTCFVLRVNCNQRSSCPHQWSTLSTANQYASMSGCTH